MVLQEAVGIKDIKAAADEAHTSAGAAKAEAAEAKSQATKALATALSSGTEKIRADILTNAEQLDVLRRSLDALSVQVKSLTSPPTAATTATPAK